MLAVSTVASAQTRSEIKEPGNHKMYAWELEPHLVVQWNDYAPCTNTGFGPGVRATIPFLDNGPIPKINNNMGIGFGLDWAHSSIGNCAQYRNNNGVFYGNGFTADIWSVPVVVQWNFFLLSKLSVFGEAGLVFQHYRYDNGYNGTTCNNGFCTGNYNNTDVNPTFSAGGRFMVSDSVGFLVRLGFPYFSAGVSILL
jgi:hypothetical protein